MRRWLLALCGILSACWWEDAVTPVLYPARFDQLPGWQADDFTPAYASFRDSCEVLHRQTEPWEFRWRVTGGEGLRVTSDDLRAVCREVKPQADEEEARTFFETQFTPYLLTRDGWPAGRITGYYAPVLQGAYHRTERFRWPVYGLPPETILQRLPPDLVKEPPSPMPDRAAIDAGALAGRKLELLWVDDPVMRFFLHVQGSGFVEMTDGSRVQLRYAGKNGHPYVPIGRVMAERGLLPLEKVNMPAIRDWLRAHPDKQDEIFAQNPSYVFFSLEKDAPPVVGAQGAPLTGGRSLAVDNTLYPYGLPMFLTTAVPMEGNPRGDLWQRLMIAQDTGSAIRGPIRADIYFGEGRTAEAQAGHMNSDGSLVLLVPKTAAERLHVAP